MSAFDCSLSTGVGALARRERERGLVGVRHARDRRRAPRSPRCRASRPARLAQRREQVAEDDPLGRQPVHVDGRRADDAEPALAAERSSRARSAPSTCSARAGRRASPTARTTRSPRVRSAMSPYLSDCIPDDRVAIQPPSVEWVKLSGKWPIVQPRGVELLLERAGRARRPGSRRGARPGRSIEHPVEAARCRPRAPAAPRRPAPRGCRRCSSRRRTGSRPRRRRARRRRSADELRLAPRAHHEVRDPTEVAARVADQVAQALAARVDHPVERIVDTCSAPIAVQRGPQRRVGARLRARADRRTRSGVDGRRAMSTRGGAG